MGQSRRCSPVQAPDRRVGGRSVNDFQLTGAARSAARRTQAMVPEGAECSPSIRIAFRRVEPCPPHWRQLPQPEPAPPVASAPARRLLRRVSAQDRGGRQRPRRLGACQVSRAKSDVCAQNIRYAGGRGAGRPDLEAHGHLHKQHASEKPGRVWQVWNVATLSGSGITAVEKLRHLLIAGRNPSGPIPDPGHADRGWHGLPGNPVSATTRHPDQAPPVGVRLTPMTHHRPRPARPSHC